MILITVIPTQFRIKPEEAVKFSFAMKEWRHKKNSKYEPYSALLVYEYSGEIPTSAPSHNIHPDVSIHHCILHDKQSRKRYETIIRDDNNDIIL